MEDFKKPQSEWSGLRWMWWLYIVVGCFIVCLLIWMFSVISKDSMKYDNPQISPIATEQITE